MDKGLEQARKRYQWSTATKRVYNRDGHVISMYKEDVFETAFRPDTDEEKAAKVERERKAKAAFEKRYGVQPAQETSRRPARRI